MQGKKAIGKKREGKVKRALRNNEFEREKNKAGNEKISFFLLK